MIVDQRTKEEVPVGSEVLGTMDDSEFTLGPLSEIMREDAKAKTEMKVKGLTKDAQLII